MIRDLAPTASWNAGGYWQIPDFREVSYPDDGHDFCSTVEDASFWFVHRNHAILEAVRRFPPAQGPILDVGSGNGYVASALQRAGYDTIAIEPRLPGVLHAVRRGVQNVLQGTLPSPSVLLSAAGAIGLFDVIEHVQEDREWLRHLRPHLVPDGRVYITTPAFEWLWSDVDARSGHFRRYSLPQLTEIVEDAGFAIDYRTYIFWAVPPVMFATRHLFPSRAGGKVEHTAGGSAGRVAAQCLFGWEKRMIRHGMSLPFGGTCLLVGRRAAV